MDEIFLGSYGRMKVYLSKQPSPALFIRIKDITKSINITFNKPFEFLELLKQELNIYELYSFIRALKSGDGRGYQARKFLGRSDKTLVDFIMNTLEEENK